MKRCRRCGCGTLAIIRESVNRRGLHRYAVCWYECPQCGEVSLSYRPSVDASDVLMAGIADSLDAPSLQTVDSHNAELALPH